MEIVLRTAVVDTSDPRATAEFYRALLGWTYLPGHEEPDPDGEEWLVLQAPNGSTRLAVQRSDRPVPPWRQDARVHLDFGVADLAAGHDHAVASGATPLTGTPEEEGHPDDAFRVYADPMGHPFCLVELTPPETDEGLL